MLHRLPTLQLPPPRARATHHFYNPNDTLESSHERLAGPVSRGSPPTLRMDGGPDVSPRTTNSDTGPQQDGQQGESDTLDCNERSATWTRHHESYHTRPVHAQPDTMPLPASASEHRSATPTRSHVLQIVSDFWSSRDQKRQQRNQESPQHARWKTVPLASQLASTSRESRAPRHIPFDIPQIPSHPVYPHPRR